METHSQDYKVQQALANLHEAKARISFAETIAQRDYQQALTDLYKWTRRYELAVQKDDHDLANKAKFQMERHEAIATRLANLAGEQIPHLASIKQKLSFYKSTIGKLNGRSIPNLQNNHEQLKTQNFQEINEDFNQLDLSQLQHDVEDVDEELEALKKQISGFNFSQEQKLVESKPEDLLKLSIQQTEQAIQIAMSRLALMNEDYQKAHDETIKLRKEVIIALQTSTDSNDNALILEILVSKTTTEKYINLMKDQIEQQNNTIKILKSNLNTLKGFKSCFDSNLIIKSNIGNSNSRSNPPQCELDKSSDEELELLRKQLDEM